MPKSTIQFEQLVPVIDLFTAARRREVWEVVLLHESELSFANLET